MRKTKKAPEWEIVNIDRETGEEDLLGAGTYESCRETMDNALEEADEAYQYNGIGAYPMMRIQAFQGW